MGSGEKACTIPKGYQEEDDKDDAVDDEVNSHDKLDSNGNGDFDDDKVGGLFSDGGGDGEVNNNDDDNDDDYEGNIDDDSEEEITANIQ
jgi:hypothetical protein